MIKKGFSRLGRPRLSVPGDGPATPPTPFTDPGTGTPPMSLTRRDVEHIAHLARLSLSEDELTAATTSLSNIVAFVDQLNAVEAAGVEPMAHPLAGQVQRLRPDVVTETDQHAKYQANAAQVEAGLYLVPKVIE